MNGIFKKIKQRARAVQIIKACAVGLSLAFLTVGVWLLLSHHEVWSVADTLAWPVGAAVCLLVGGLAYLLLHTSDTALARRLDTQLCLQERVQTMHEFREVQGAMYELQREDTQRALDDAHVRTPGARSLWIYALCLLLCVAVMVTGFLWVPAEPPPEEEEEIPFAVSETQLAALAELIAYVEGSDMQEPYRTGVADTLRTLVGEIGSATTESECNEVVTRAMHAILATTDESSLAVELINAIWSNDGAAAKNLAKALNYYAWPTADEWDKFIATVTEFRKSFVYADGSAEELSDAVILNDTKFLLQQTAAAITAALQSAKLPSDDPLAVVLTRLANANETGGDGADVFGLATLADKIDEIGYTAAGRELDATLAVLNGELFRALEINAENTGTGEYAVKRLSALFDCALPGFERPLLYEGGAEDAPSGEGGGGGGISIGPIYGSDDLVLDPLTNELVEYGTILERYRGIMFNYAEDGVYTAEEKAMLEKYFDILRGGFDEGNDEQE